MLGVTLGVLGAKESMLGAKGGSVLGATLDVLGADALRCW